MIRAILIIVFLSGCSSLSGKPEGFEYAYHALNVVDMGQTIHIAREPDCYYEKGFPTKEIIGRHPDQEEVYALMAAYSVGFHYMNRWLDNKASESYMKQDGHYNKWKFARGVFNATSFYYKADAVVSNHDKGLRPWGNGC